MRRNEGPVHEHELIIRDKGEGDGRVLKCRGCREEIPGQIYHWCTLCRCYFHEGCAKLALEIKLFFHSCPLFLHTISSFECYSCFKYCPNGFTYLCQPCGFKICVECAAPMLSLATCEGESSRERILHPCHRHPIQPLVEESKSMSSCRICEMPCSFGPIWGCEPCDFHLHKPCLDFLPERAQFKMDYRVASCRLLTLPGEKCVDCRKSISSNLVLRVDIGFLHTTDNILCISCCLVRRFIDESSLPEVITTHFLHPCPNLKLILSPSTTCNACLLSNHPFNYHCNSCDFFLCLDCVQLPQLGNHEKEVNQLVNHFCHWHPLKLFTGTQGHNHMCNLCERSCSEQPFYSCINLCQFYVHKSCMDSLPHKTNHLLFNPPVVLLRVLSFECTTCNRQCSGLAFYCGERKCKFCVKCVMWPENVLGEDGRFKSILHWHQLSLCETKIEDKRRTCFLCKEPCIPWTLSYKCGQCALFFHKSCAELEHPIHPQHPLTLTNRSSSLPNEAMTCKICLKSLSQNFPLYDVVYHCEPCDFQLDTQCATFLPSVKHKGHPHILYIVVNMHGNIECRACCKSCDGSCTIRCAYQECYFALHFQCGPLPYTVKHASHVHPLILKDYYVEDNGSDEFACHICEEGRDPRLRVYCCSRGCLMICDVKCVLNEVLPLLRGERGEVELRTPFPQVACRVINDKLDLTEVMVDPTIEGAGDGILNTKHLFLDDLTRAFYHCDVEERETNKLTPKNEKEDESTSRRVFFYNSDESSSSSTSLDEEANEYSFSWKALSHFEKSLSAPSVDDFDDYYLRQYDGDITTGAYALPEILDSIYKEFFGMYDIITDHKYKLKYEEKRFLIFITVAVLHQMRTTKVVDVRKKIILKWLELISFVEERGKFNVGFIAENIKRVWQARYYIQSKKIVDDKTSRLEQALEQVAMYKAELRTKMDEADARQQELKLMDKEHDTYRVVGSRGPMKKVRSDALDIKWRTCYESLITYPGNAPAI